MLQPESPQSAIERILNQPILIDSLDINALAKNLPLSWSQRQRMRFGRFDGVGYHLQQVLSQITNLQTIPQKIRNFAIFNIEHSDNAMSEMISIDSQIQEIRDLDFTLLEVLFRDKLPTNQIIDIALYLRESYDHQQWADFDRTLEKARAAAYKKDRTVRNFLEVYRDTIKASIDAITSYRNSVHIWVGLSQLRCIAPVVEAIRKHQPDAEYQAAVARADNDLAQLIDGTEIKGFTDWIQAQLKDVQQANETSKQTLDQSKSRYGEAPDAYRRVREIIKAYDDRIRELGKGSYHEYAQAVEERRSYVDTAQKLDMLLQELGILGMKEEWKQRFYDIHDRLFRYLTEQVEVYRPNTSHLREMLPKLKDIVVL